MIKLAAIMERLDLLGIRPISHVMTDMEFTPVPRDWLEGPFSTSFKTNLEALGLSYELEVFDCDKYAFLSKAMASVCYARSKKKRRGGLAFGVFIYSPATTDTTRHAINIAFISDTCEVLFYEPQWQRQILLAPEEIRTCSGIVI